MVREGAVVYGNDNIFINTVNTLNTFNLHPQPSPPSTLTTLNPQAIPHSVDILDRKCLVELFLKAMSCPGNLTLVELRNGIAVLKESIQNEKDGIYEDCSQRLVCGDLFICRDEGHRKNGVAGSAGTRG